MPVEMAGVAVIVPHESFRPAENAALRILKCGGDDSLELERKDIRSLCPSDNGVRCARA